MWPVYHCQVLGNGLRHPNHTAAHYTFMNLKIKKVNELPSHKRNKKNLVCLWEKAQLLRLKCHNTGPISQVSRAVLTATHGTQCHRLQLHHHHPYHLLQQKGSLSGSRVSMTGGKERPNKRLNSCGPMAFQTFQGRGKWKKRNSTTTVLSVENTSPRRQVTVTVNFEESGTAFLLEKPCRSGRQKDNMTIFKNIFMYYFQA